MPRPSTSPWDGERGFSVLETLIATAIVVLMALTALGACTVLARVATSSTSAQHSAEEIDAQAALLRNDAATAFAVFIPEAGPLGNADSGREIDFYAKTADGRAIRWRYSYDAAAQTLQRSDYDLTGAAGVRDVKTGAIDTSAAYPPLRRVTSFLATNLPADGLGDPQRNIYSGVAGLLQGTPQSHLVRYERTVAGLPDAVGGNRVVQVRLSNESAARVVHLAAGSMPAGFTVTGLPVWHAIVYRVDQSHRFLLGVASKSHVFINARVDVSYDGWNTKITWCDFNLLGNPDGLDPHDPHADYKPGEPIERAENILAACRERHPLPPPRDSAGNPPDADALHPPLPGQTAPPCWTHPGPAGRCRPANAPPDWTPPAPGPNESPPPEWCTAHGDSPVCAGGRGSSSS